MKRLPKIPKKYIKECNAIVEAIIDRFDDVVFDAVQDSTEFDGIIFDDEELFDKIYDYINLKVKRDYK